jgi:hypothetical protein
MAKPNLFGGGSTIYDAQAVYEVSGLQPGTVGLLGGRSYVWCSYSGSDGLTRGEPLVAAEINPTTQNLSITTGGLHVGQTEVVDITAGGSAITDSEFDNGYLAVTDGGGEGNTYEIEHNIAFTAATADGTVKLRDAIVVASDADTEVSLIKNKYVDPQQSNSFGDNSFVGVPNVTVPDGSTDTQYFWAQRSGYCAVFVKGEAKKGTEVIVSAETDGRLEAVAVDVEVQESLSGGAKHVVPFDTTQVVGIMVTDAIDGEIQIVDLQNTIV